MKSLFDLAGKVVPVSGSGGIGIGMAEGLARQGASVDQIAVDRGYTIY